MDREQLRQMKERVALLDSKLAYIQLLLERMEVLARRVADGVVPPDCLAELQQQFQDLIADIDYVADTLPASIEPPSQSNTQGGTPHG